MKKIFIIIIFILYGCHNGEVPLYSRWNDPLSTYETRHLYDYDDGFSYKYTDTISVYKGKSSYLQYDYNNVYVSYKDAYIHIKSENNISEKSIDSVKTDLVRRVNAIKNK